MVQACAGTGCPQQCEAAELGQATVSSITAATSLGCAADERQVRERTALPGNPQARECAGAAAPGYSLAQAGAGDEPSDTAGAILVQKSVAAHPEFGLELDRTTVHGYPQARECAADSVSSQEKVTDEVSAVRKVHVSVVHKEPRFHEEAQEWWLPQVETELQVAIQAAVIAIGAAEIP